MRLLSVVGARPQFVKAAVLLHAFAAWARETGRPLEHRLLHTGQHHDAALSGVFFEQLGLPAPAVSLHIGSAKHGAQTGAMLAGIEEALEARRPDAVLVYGDTNSTLAGALAAAKLAIPLVHLEAGLRSFDPRMPEEINRIVSDSISTLLLCPTATAIENLRREGRAADSVWVGDVMLDAVARYAPLARREGREALGLSAKGYALATLHRAANTDEPAQLDAFTELLLRLPLPAVLPMHPRLEKSLGPARLARLRGKRDLHLLPPAPYLAMLGWEQDARLILTDSGGVQKEAYFLGVPSVTLREETEWVETVHDGWNTVTGLHPARALAAVERVLCPTCAPRPERNLARFGGGRAGRMAVEAVANYKGGLLCGTYS